jgi:hypothetical protein
MVGGDHVPPGLPKKGVIMKGARRVPFRQVVDQPQVAQRAHLELGLDAVVAAHAHQLASSARGCSICRSRR